MVARLIRDEEVVGSSLAIPTWLMCRLMGRRRAVKVGYVICGLGITVSVEHRCIHGNCGSSPRTLTNDYTDMAQLGEQLPYKEKVVGSSPSVGTKN